MGPDGRDAVQAFGVALSKTWAQEDPVQGFAQALLAVAPEEHFVVHPGAVHGAPEWTLSDIFPGYRGRLPSHRELPRFRSYGAYGERDKDPFANRPVNLRDLATCVGTLRVEEIAQELFLPIGFYHQLRTVLYDARGHVCALVGYYRPQGDPPFTVMDHARLYAMQPALRSWIRLAKALGFAPLGNDALINAVHAIPGPALVLHGDNPVFANASARACAAEWRDVNPRQFGHVIPLRSRELPLDLCLWPSKGTTAQEAGRFDALPPYLQTVAELLALGLADKDIAARLDAPLSTARTYVQRVLRLLGVRDRRALMRADG